MLSFWGAGGVTASDTAGSIGQLQMITGGLLTWTAVVLSGDTVPVGLAGSKIGGGITFDKPGDAGVAGVLTQSLMSRVAISRKAKNDDTITGFCWIGIVLRLHKKSYNICFNYENNRNYRVRN